MQAPLNDHTGIILTEKLIAFLKKYD